MYVYSILAFTDFGGTYAMVLSTDLSSQQSSQKEGTWEYMHMHVHTYVRICICLHVHDCIIKLVANSMTVSYQWYAVYICNNDGTGTALNPVALSTKPYTVYTYVWNVSVYICMYTAVCKCLIFGVYTYSMYSMYVWHCTCVHVHTLLCMVQCIHVGNVLLPETIAITTESDRAWNRSQHSIYSTLHWLMIPICLVPVFLHFIYIRTECMYVCMRCSHVFIALYSCHCRCVHMRTCT